MGLPPLPSVLSKMQPLGSRPTKCAVTDLMKVKEVERCGNMWNDLDQILM